LSQTSDTRSPEADPYAIIVLRSNGPKATAALLFT
jgi:hypothetical protein